MMSNNRRKQRCEIHHQEPRSQHKKPPLHVTWQPTVPSWEKKFCYAVGSVPWRKLLETKSSMYLYDNVVQWNDSAGEEAFKNAKNRYWAEINGLPCDISLPDPDTYIDEIDWSSDVDPEFLLDLDREPKDLEQNNKEDEGVILGSLLLNQSFSCTRWGDAEDEVQKDADSALGPGYGNCDKTVDNVENPWESNDMQNNRSWEENGRGNHWVDASGWKNTHQNDANYNGWENVNYDTNGDWAMLNETGRKTDGGGWNMSRYKTSRFGNDDYHLNHGLSKNGKGRKRVNFVY